MPHNEVVVARQGGQWTCSPDPVVPVGQNAQIRFLLQDDTHRFRDQDPVVVDDPGSQFPEKSRTQDPKTAKLLDKNTERGSFKYTVYLVDAQGREVVIDPTIKNEER